MPAISFPVSSRPACLRPRAPGRLINAFVEQLGDGARAPASRRRAPGLLQFTDTRCYRPRGLSASSGRTCCRLPQQARRGRRRRHGELLGTLPGAGRVTIARNNRAPVPDAVAVTEYGAYQVTPTSSPRPLSILAACRRRTRSPSCSASSSSPPGTATATPPGSTALPSTPWITPSSRPAPAASCAVSPSGTSSSCSGPSGIGVYGGQAQANGFPLARITGIPRGLIGPWAVAGQEEGWSNELIWVGDDAVVYKLAATPRPGSRTTTSSAISRRPRRWTRRPSRRRSISSLGTPSGSCRCRTGPGSST